MSKRSHRLRHPTPPPPPPPAKKDNLWLDPKLWFSAAAVIVSVIIGYATCNHNKLQDTTSDNLNMARISITSIEFLTTKLISRNEFHNMDWGYDARPLVDPREDDPNLKNVKVINTIVPYIRKTREMVPNTFSITIPEILRFLHIPLTDTTYYLRKQYTIVINFRNSGQTICKLDSIMVRDNLLDAKDNKEPHRLKGDFYIMEPNTNYNSSFQMDLDIAKQLPDSFNFKCDFCCRNVNDVAFVKTINVKYMLNYFYFSDVEN